MWTGGSMSATPPATPPDTSQCPEHRSERADPADPIIVRVCGFQRADGSTTPEIVAASLHDHDALTPGHALALACDLVAAVDDRPRRKL